MIGYKNSRVFIHEFTRLIIMKMNMKNISHRCEINRPRSTHGYKCSKSKKSLGIIMLICINLLSANFTKWSNTFRQFVGKLLQNCLSVFDHFVGLAL